MLITTSLLPDLLESIIKTAKIKRAKYNITIRIDNNKPVAKPNRIKVFIFFGFLCQYSNSKKMAMLRTVPTGISFELLKISPVKRGKVNNVKKLKIEAERFFVIL